MYRLLHLIISRKPEWNVANKDLLFRYLILTAILGKDDLKLACHEVGDVTVQMVHAVFWLTPSAHHPLAQSLSHLFFLLHLDNSYAFEFLFW